MKKGILLFALSALTNYNYAQTTVFSEDFESGLDNWTIQIEDAFTVDTSLAQFAPGWIIVADPIGSTDSVAAATSFFTTPGKANRWLISPPIAVGSFGNIISWNARSFDPSYPDGYRVLVSNTTNDVSAFTDTISLITQEYEEWTTRSVNLSDSGYVDQTIYVAFILDSYDMYKLYLDDISMVIEDPVGLNEEIALKWALYPNPANDILNIQSDSDLKDYRILTMNGQIVGSGTLDNQSISVSDLQSGTYFLEVRTQENAVYRKRFMKG